MLYHVNCIKCSDNIFRSFDIEKIGKFIKTHESQSVEHICTIEEIKSNLDYFNHATKDLSTARKDSICAYLVGAASVLIEEKQWQSIVNDAVVFFDRVHAGKTMELETELKSIQEGKE